MSPKKSIPIKSLKDNLSALEKLSRCLDRVFPHIKCWLHFAEEMKIESKVICQCRLYSENSPTVKLFEFLKATRPQLSVKELSSAMIEIRRVDIHRIIFKTCKSEDNVSEVITDSSSDIMDTIALELDSASKPIGNWENLAQKLEVPRNIYQKFAMYSDYDPTKALVRHLYTASEKPILLKDFMDCFKKMGRQDVLKKVKESVEDMRNLNANEALKVGSDLLQETADLLNKDTQSVGGWRELGSHFKVDSFIMDSLEPSRDKEVHGPTTKVINWLAAARPSTTINDVAKALENIKRYDALKILRSFFDVDVSYEKSKNIEVLDIVADLDEIPEIDINDEDVNRRSPTPINEALLGIQATEQRKTEDGKRNFGIPSKTIELIGRKKEKEELLDSLINGKYQMVVMRGTPGCGKTTLAVNVAHDIIEDPHCYSVVYVDSKDVFSLEDLAYKILTTRGITSSANCPISQVTDLFSHSNQKCVLILENLDHMYHSIDKMNETFSRPAGSIPEEFSSKKDEFQCFLKDLVKSTTKLKIVVTTWELVAFLSIKPKHMELGPLNDEESLELLRSRIDKPLRPEDQEAIDTIIQCCGRIPLLLCAAVVVVTELGSVEAAAKHLASCPPEEKLKSLSSNSLSKEERLDHCLGICFKRMNVCSRKVLVLLSVFPNLFTLKQAEHIAKASKIDEDQLKEGFQSFRRFCFLNTYDVKSEKYVLDPAIRSFGISKAKQDEDLKTVFEAARRRFISYTFNILSEIEKEFFSTQSKSAIQKYRLQDDNIREIARWCITDRSMDVKVKQFCIQSFIDSQSVLLKLMRSHPLKLILYKFCQFCQNDETLAQLYCECLILGGAKIVIGCLCTPYMCSTALKEALGCFLKAFKALKTESGAASTEEAISDLVSSNVPNVIMQSDAISDQAKARFLIKGGKCLVMCGHKDVGFYYIQNGIKIRSQCHKASPGNMKHLVMMAVGCNDSAVACTFVGKHTDAVLLRDLHVLPIYNKVLGIHPFTATAHSQLARNYLELGDYDKAVQANEIALSYRRTLLGDHQDTARSLFDQGAILSEQAQVKADQSTKFFEEALSYLQGALDMQRRVLDTPEETAITYQKLAFVLSKLGREEEAEQQMQMIEECYEKMEQTTQDDLLPHFSESTNQEDAVDNTATEREPDFVNENFALGFEHRVFVSVLENTIRVMKPSVGGIIVKDDSDKPCKATCFRIGTKYVITNQHVVDGISKRDIKWSNCYVDFNYGEQGQPGYCIDFARDPVLFSSDPDEKLDYAILKLNPEGRNLPPSVVDPDSGFNIAPPEFQLQGRECITFIGHPGGMKKQIDVSCPIKYEQDIKEYLDQQHLNHTIHKAYYDVSMFFNGASGSPGFLMEKNLLVVLHSGGRVRRNQETNKNNVLEYGTLMSSVVKDVMAKINNGTIKNVELDEIFGGSTNQVPGSV